jgi:hypothetical protein
MKSPAAILAQESYSVEQSSTHAKPTIEEVAVTTPPGVTAVVQQWPPVHGDRVVFSRDLVEGGIQQMMCSKAASGVQTLEPWYTATTVLVPAGTQGIVESVNGNSKGIDVARVIVGEWHHSVPLDDIKIIKRGEYGISEGRKFEAAVNAAKTKEADGLEEQPIANDDDLAGYFDSRPTVRPLSDKQGGKDWQALILDSELLTPNAKAPKPSTEDSTST